MTMFVCVQAGHLPTLRPGGEGRGSGGVGAVISTPGVGALQGTPGASRGRMVGRAGRSSSRVVVEAWARGTGMAYDKLLGQSILNKSSTNRIET